MATKQQRDDERLKELETIIRRGKDTWLKVGAALKEIHGRKLYLKTHTSFEKYCIETFEFTRKNAHELMRAVDVTHALQSAGKPAPVSVRDALDKDPSTPRYKRVDKALQQTNPEVHREWQAGRLTNRQALAAAGDEARLLSDSRKNRESPSYEPSERAPLAVVPMSPTRIYRETCEARLASVGVNASVTSTVNETAKFDIRLVGLTKDELEQLIEMWETACDTQVRA
jgi:hypothetical protein